MIVLCLLCVSTPGHAKQESGGIVDPNGTLDAEQRAQLRVAVERAKLLPPLDGLGGLESFAGTSVSISGNRALVGATGMAGSGAAIVFADNGSGWEQEAVLLPSGDGTAIQFGYSVSLEGNRALIGARLDSQGGVVSGSAFVFEFDGSDWVESARIVPADGIQNGLFGESLSLDGDRALIGALADDDNGFGTGAAYLFEFNGTSWSQFDKLVPADAEAGDAFGGSVSLSGDWALIGSRADDDNGPDSGSAYVFGFDGAGWTEHAKLVASDGAQQDVFGRSVAIDGNRALIGAVGSDDTGSNAGAAYVFELLRGIWVETGKLVASTTAEDQFGRAVHVSGDRVLVGTDSDSAYVFDFNGTSWSPGFRISSTQVAAGDRFGYAVALSGDRALIGAPLRDAVEADTGAAFVFDFDGARWIERAELVPALNPAEDLFGFSVSLDGDRALIGAFGDDDNGRDAGAAYIFDRDGSAWNLSAKLLPADGDADDRFGRAVSLSGDTAVVGVQNDEDAGFDAGSAYVFEFDGQTWVEVAKLLASDAESDDRFGNAVSVFGDRVLIGARAADNDTVQSAGAAYLFERQSGVWTQIARIRAPDSGAGDWFGQSVSLGPDRALIGAPNDDDNGLDAGAAYIFHPFGSLWRIGDKLLASDGASVDLFGQSVSLRGDRALIGAYADDDVANASGAAYVFDRSGSEWIQSQKLTAADGQAGDFFGFDVSLGDDFAAIGARNGDGLAADSGSVYLFEFNGTVWSPSETLIADDGAEFDRFGKSVSVSGDRVLIGAYFDDDRGIASGSAYVFDPNQVPIARPDQFITDEDSAMSGNALADNGNGMDFDLDGDPLEVVQVAGAAGTLGVPFNLPSGALLTMHADGSFDYDPSGQFDQLGIDGVTVDDGFTYTISDGFDTATALVRITISGIDDPPVAVDDQVILIEDAPATTILVLANDTDIDGGPISVTGVTQPTFGTAEIINGGLRVAYTPDPGTCNNGEPPDEFTYTLAPGGSTATVSAIVECANDAPTADDGTANTPEDTDVFILLTGSDPEGAPLAFFVVDGPSNGSLGSLVVLDDTTARVQYTPDPDFFGTDSITFRVNDGTLSSANATMAIDVRPVNDPPDFVAGGDVAEIEDAAYAEAWATAINPGPVNEADQAVSFVVNVMTNPDLFAVAPSVDDTGILGFLPAPDMLGSATIEVRAVDDGGTAGGGVDVSAPEVFVIDVIAATDLVIDKTSGALFAPTGGPVSYTIVVSNPGPSDVVQATVIDAPPARLGDVTWTCSADPGAACAPNGSIEINERVDLPEGTSVTFTLDAQLLDSANDPITNMASVTAPVGVLELDSASNSDSDTDLVGLFADGMESVEP